ncbi:hypothetical protein [Rhizobium jaguaris]|nr:hypothetical protein [Rhizobium jaguaris]
MRPEDVLSLYETKIKLRRFDELVPLIADDAANSEAIRPLIPK